MPRSSATNPAHLSARLGALAASVLFLAGTPGLHGFVSPAAAQQEAASSGEDEITLKNGKVIRGRLVSETATEVRFEIRIGGISAPTTYQKAEILSIKRAAAADADSSSGAAPAAAVPAAPATSNAATPAPAGPVATAEATPQTGAPVVYFMPLRGAFGRDISTDVVEDMLKDAKRHRPDYLIIEIDRDWKIDAFDAAPDDVGEQAQFDEFDTADQIEALLTEEMPRTWDKVPHIVVWVKQAMGGAAFLPFIANDIFFAPDGRMGGIGNLGELFEGVGDKVVRQKQRSLRLARAQGMAIAGGYDYRLVTAMAIRAYELSYRIDGGKATLFEGAPKLIDEITLTDNGEGSNRDTMIDAVRGTGDDVLTLKEETAKLLGVSRGTAATLDDVLAGLGILRNHQMADGRGERIMTARQEEMDRISRDLPKLWEDFGRVAIGRDGVEDELQLLARRQAILEDLKAAHLRYRDALFAPENPFTFDPLPPGYAFPRLAEINVMLEQIKVQRMSIR